MKIFNVYPILISGTRSRYWRGTNTEKDITNYHCNANSVTL